MDVSPDDIRSLREEKYSNNQDIDLSEDIARLEAGEPLAYVIGTQPFLSLSIHLDSRPLIPRPETEWWTEKLIETLGDTPVSVLDLCAGSGAIGLAVAAHCKHAQVTLSEIDSTHIPTIEKNISANGLDTTRITLVNADVFSALTDKKFNYIACNPPYIPDTRALEESVSEFEPALALFSGSDGLTLIERILTEAPSHLMPQGQLWMECDITNIEKAAELAKIRGATSTQIHTDPYGRPRLLIAYY